MNKATYIKKMHLVNFMSFKDRIIDFAQDATVIVGPNGSGKSAILAALALTFNQKDRGTVAASSYIMKDTEQAIIELDCVISNIDYNIRTELNFTGRLIHRTLTTDNLKLENTKAAAYLESIIDSSELSIAFALQGNEKFLTVSPAQNLKKFTNLLNLDFLKEINYARENGKVYTTKSQESYTRTQVLNQTKINLTEDLKTTESKLTKLPDIEKPDPDKLDFLNAELEKKLQEKYKIEAELNNILAKEANTVALEKDLELTRAKIAKTQAQYEELTEYLSKVEIVNLDSLEKDIQSNQDNLNELKDNKNKLATENIELTSKQVQFETNLATEKKRFADLQGDNCPLCRQRITTDLKLDLKSCIDDITKSIQTISEEKAALNEKSNELQNKIAEASKENYRLNNEKTNAAVLNTQIGSKLELKDQVESSLKLLKQSEAKLVDQLSEVKNYSNEIKDLQQSKDIALKAYTDLSNQCTQEQKLQNDFTINTKLKEDLLDSKSKLENRLEQLETEIAIADADLEKYKKAVDSWTSSQQVFLKIPKLHLKRFIGQLKKLCNKIITRFNYDGCKLRYDENESELEFFLKKDGKDISYIMCSSFERNLLNLAAVYALTYLFAIPFVCIDEADASADTVNTQILSSLILDIANKVPVVVVSHDESLTNALISPGISSTIFSTVQQ